MTQIATPMTKSLVPADPNIVRSEVGLIDPQTISVSEAPDPQLDQQATAFVEAVLKINPDEASGLDARQQNVAAVETLGSGSQQEAAHRSAMLKEPIRKLAARGEDGGEVANALVNLKVKVEELDPNKIDFEIKCLRKNGISIINTSEIIVDILESLKKSTSKKADIAAAFQVELGKSFAKLAILCAKENNIKQIGLSGGVGYNYSFSRAIKDEIIRNGLFL